jgi:hypothetical protein
MLSWIGCSSESSFESYYCGCSASELHWKSQCLGCLLAKPLSFFELIVEIGCDFLRYQKYLFVAPGDTNGTQTVWKQ